MQPIYFSALFQVLSTLTQFIHPQRQTVLLKWVNDSLSNIQGDC